MYIIEKRKKIPAQEYFENLDCFLDYLKENYSKLNYGDEVLLKKSSHVYNKLVKEEGSVRILRMSRWLHNQFGFSSSNFRQRIFWEERGWGEEYIDSIFLEMSVKTSEELKKRERIDKSLFCVNKDIGSIEVVYKSAKFMSDKHPTCNVCGSKLRIERINRKSNVNDFYFKIKGCCNGECKSNSKKGYDSYYNYLPEDIADQFVSELSEKNKSYNIYNIQRYLREGKTEEEATDIISNLQKENSSKVKVRYGKSKEMLRSKGFSEDEIKRICLTPSSKEFWISRGFSEEEASKKVKSNQKNASSYVDYESRLLPSNVEYWIERGFSKEDAKLKVSEHQSTFSLKKCIEKYGEKKGKEVFTERQEKWQKSLLENGNLKIGYSKISQDLFFEILKSMKSGLGNIFFATKNEEYKLTKLEGGVWMYDFADIGKKKIIEYNGDQYHANPTMFSENDLPHPFRKNIKAKDIWNKDKRKIDMAKSKGFDVMVVWDSEYRKNKEEVLKKCLKFLGLRK